MTAPEKIIFSWSGGKDSALALEVLLRNSNYEVVTLLTSVSAEYRRISHHGVREEILELQAAAIGVPLDCVYLPTGPDHGCSNAIYEEIMEAKMNHYRSEGVRTVAFGDIFLEDLRQYRESNLAKVDMAALFPLWRQDTAGLAQRFIKSGFKAYLSCVEPVLGARLAGRSFDQDLLADLPPEVDPCGENGEYHTYVWDGPIFNHPVDVSVGEIVERDGRHYADLLPHGATASTAARQQHSIPPVGQL
jgi:uncharacterized protein (TIGR00290 family)